MPSESRPSESRRRGWDCGLILLLCGAVYGLNERTISSGDSIPNTMLAFNWLVNGTFHFDAFRDGFLYQLFDNRPYFFVETKIGHLTPSYPIGTAIVTFPLYIVFYFYLLATQTLDITNASFEVQRVLFEKLAAIAVASLSVVLFYLITRLKFSPCTSLITTFVFAFATSTWTVSSQGLWQQGSTNLVLLGIILGLWKANRVDNRPLLIAGGVLCGLLPIIRPTNVLFWVGIGVYVVATYRKNALFFILGMSSALLGIAWNFYYFGTLTGGYGVLYKLYSFTWKQFSNASLGLLFSPSRGIFVFSPVLLFAIPGLLKLFKQKFQKDEQLILCLVPACLLLYLQYCFFQVWWAGFSYGPRFFTDALPIFCLLIAYGMERIPLRIFAIALMYSVFVQIVGAFGTLEWNTNPVTIDTPKYPEFANMRLWQLRDSQIERTAKSVFFQIANPAENPAYAQGLNGIILDIQDINKKQIQTSISVKPGASILLRAKAKNTGTSQWLGYETGLIKGPTRIRVRFFEGTQLISDQRLHLSGNAKSDQIAPALGLVSFPQPVGIYRVVFDLVAEGIQEINPEGTSGGYTLIAEVRE